MKVVKRIFTLLLVFVLLLGGLVFFVIGTESGLQVVGQMLESQLGEGLHIGRLGGRLATDFEVEDLRVQVNDDVYTVRHLQLNWSPRALTSGEIRINRLTAESVTISIAASAEPADNDFSLDVDLPVDITLAESAIRSLVIDGLTEEMIIIEQVGLSARAANQQLDIHTLQLTADSYQAGLAGIVGLQPDKDSDLQLEWHVQIPGETAFVTTGQANITGLLHDYRLQGQSDLSGDKIPAGHLQFSAKGTLDGLLIEYLEDETLDGSLTGNGQLDWQQGFDWQFALDIKQLNPARHWPEWPGDLTAQLISTGSLAENDRQVALQLLQLQGQLRGYPVAGQVDIKLKNEQLAIRHLAIESGDNSVTAAGTLDKTWELTAEADIPDMAALLPGWEGAFELSGRVQGKRDQPQIGMTVSGQQLAGPSLAIDALAGDAQIHWSEAGKQSLGIKLQSVTLAGQHYDEAILDFTGSVHQHRLTLEAEGTELAINLQLAGDWLDNTWQGEIHTAHWEFPGTGRWSLQQSVKTELGIHHIQLPETCWLNESAQLCVDVQGNPEKLLTPNVRLSQFPVQTLAALGGSPLTFTSLMNANFHATLDAGQFTQADMLIKIGAGSVSYDDPTLSSDSHIQQGVLRALLNEEGLSADAALDLTDTDYLRADLNLPRYQPAVTSWKEQPMSMTVRSELHDLLFLEQLLDEVGRYEGSVVVNLQGQGTLGQPRLSGGATVTDSILEVDKLGIRLTDLDVQVQSKADGLAITGSCDSGKGSMQLSGDVNIIDIAHWQVDVRLQGKDFEIMHLPEGVIEVSPDLQARIAPPELHLSGEVHVPYARLRPKDLSTRAGVSSDVVIIDAEQVAEPEERWQASSNIRLSLGDDVTIDGYGLKGDILGSVDLLDKPGRVTTAQGKLSIERGSYEVYGRKLDIHRGQLLFSDGPVDNPGLDFEASRKVERVTAGIRAKGSLREPELTLYSDPSMSDSDIISYIAFGKPQAEAGQGGGSVTDAGLVAGGNKLAGILGTKVGLEEFGVESGETLEEAAMVLGTYLSPQLYVRYRTGLYDAINEFEVRYEFSRRWSVRTITSVETSSAEIQFSFER
ncbi:MAG: translocation/assembly module TamB domain-containing protein [Pseudomonadota bacterium]